MGSKLPLIGTILAAVFGVIGVIMFIMVAGNEETAGGYVLYGMYLTIIGIAVAVLSFVLSLMINPSGIKGVGIGLAAVVVVALLSYAMADGSDYMDYKEVTESTSKAVSAMLNAFYVLGAGAVLAVVYSLVHRAIK